MNSLIMLKKLDVIIHTTIYFFKIIIVLLQNFYVVTFQLENILELYKNIQLVLVE